MFLAIQSIDKLWPVIIILGIILIGVISYYFSRKQILLRKLSKFNYRSVNQFRTNELTKTSGNVLHVHEPFVAPFSERKCVAFHFKIEQKKSSGKSSYWKTLVEKENIQDFFIKQGDEVVMIKPIKHPKNFFSYMVEDSSVSSGMFNDPSPEFLKVLKLYGVEQTNLLGFNKRLRYSERIIEVGEHITVAGIAKWKTLSEPLEGYSYSKIAVLESDAKQKLIITDLPLKNRQK